MTLRVLSIGSAVNLPRLQILRIDGEWVIDNVIMQGRWRHSWEKTCEKEVILIVTFDLIGLLPRPVAEGGAGGLESPQKFPDLN